MRKVSPRAEASRKYYLKNKEKIKAKVKEYRDENREDVLEKKRIYGKKVRQEDWWKEKHLEKRRKKTKEWREKNSEHIKSYNRKYKKENRELCEKIRSRRVSTKRSVTPTWLTPEDKLHIDEFYKIMRELNKLTGYRAYHVDHIIPLQGENVSGLHVPWNLQILTASDNSSKNDKFDGTPENESWRFE